ncbi:MAG TPA: hypothetical protein VGB99_01795 [Acidobacteriota bacterium]
MHHKLWATLTIAFAVFALASAPALAKNSTQIKLDEPASLAGTELTPGTYDVSWDGDGSKVTVKFVRDIDFTREKEVVAEVEGKLVDRETKHPYTMVKFGENGGGPKPIKEIGVRGMKHTIVFAAK